MRIAGSAWNPRARGGDDNALAAEDREAPAADTVAALKRLAEAGKPVKTVVFPGTDHGMMNFRMEQGARVKLGYYPDYFRYMPELLAYPVRFACAPE